MPEVTRFRSIRAPQRRIPSDTSLMHLTLSATPSAAPLAPAPLVPAPVPPMSVAPMKVPALTRSELRTLAAQPHPLRTLKLTIAQPTLADALLDLDRWLVRHDNSPEPSALRTQVEALRLDPSTQGWSELRCQATALLLQMMTSPYQNALPTPKVAAFYATMTRYLLVMGLVELLASAPDALRSSEEIHDALRWRTLVLPPAGQLTAAGMKALPSPMDMLVRRPGLADLFVVEQEWNR